MGNQKRGLTPGTVYLVGAGPGDPELITRRGERLLAKADCVIYDRLVSPDLLSMAPSRCEIIYAGKDRDEHGDGQERINRLLVQKARRGRTIVRLKGGDPTIFGRLAEEMAALRRANIPFEIVPGVSSLWAAAAAAGISLTDRRVSSSVAVATGHPAEGDHRPVRWKELARAADTLVILMGRAALPRIIRQLRQGGRPGSTPITLVRWATTPDQQILVSRLGEVQQALRERPDFAPPVVAIVGEVGKPSLQGKKILITRDRSDSLELAGRLKRMGARCVHLPTIRIRPVILPADEEKSLLARIPRFDWILFNSHHAVEALDRLARRHRTSLVRLIQGKVSAIGPRTFDALRAGGLKAAQVPEESSVAGLKRMFERIPLRGKRILIPRSNLGVGDLLAGILRRRRASVEEVALYATEELTVPADRLRRALHGTDAATFTSASTARAFLRSVRLARLPLNGTAVVAIGPSTAKALRQGGASRVVLPTAGAWNLDGLVEAVRSVLVP